MEVNCYDDNVKNEYVSDEYKDVHNKENKYIDLLASYHNTEQLDSTNINSSVLSSYYTDSIVSDDCGEIFDDEDKYLHHLASYDDTDYTNVMRKDLHKLSPNTNDYDSELLTCSKYGEIFNEKNKHLHTECRTLMISDHCKSSFLELGNCGKAFHACIDCGEVFDDQCKYLHHITFCFSNENTNIPDVNNYYSKLTSNETKTKNNAQFTNFQTSNALKALSEPRYYDPQVQRCFTCDRQFVNTNKLQVHSIIQHNVTTCFFCNAAFVEKHEVLNHLKLHVTEYKCKICNSVFLKQCDFFVHMKFHYHWICVDCGEIHRTEKEYYFETHICNDIYFEKHAKYEYVKIYGEKEYNYSRTFITEQHEKNRSEGFQYSCPISDNPDIMGNNMNMSLEGSANESWSYSNCKETFFENIKYEDRFDSVENESITASVFHDASSSKLKNYDSEHLFCSICSKQYKSRQSLRQHRQLVHGKKHHICQICNKAFTRKYDLLRHVKIHENSEGKECKLKNINCSDVSSQEYNSCTHVKTLHRCDVCDESFSHNHDLFDHMKIHEEEELYSCDNCHKMFNDERKFVTHQISCPGNKHIDYIISDSIFSYPSKPRSKDIKQAVCEICNKEFKSKQGLQLHSLVHSGIKDHVCTICNKAFGLRYSLTRHMKGHENPKVNIRFTCDICNQRFNLKINIVKHMMKHQNCKRKMYKCDVCSKMCKGKGGLKRHKRIHYTL